MMSPGEIPLELRALPQWVVWCREQRGDGEPTKVPQSARNLKRRASVTDPTSWSTFEAALAAFQSNPGTVAGIGFVFTDDDTFTGVDIDDCIAPDGSIDPEVQQLVKDLDSYTEISPSGTGLHVFIHGRFVHPVTGKSGGSAAFPGAKKVEIYWSKRFFTVTGNPFPGTPATIEARQEQLDQLAAKLWPHQPRGKATPKPRPVQDDEELLERARHAKNGAKFSRLFDRGDITGHADDDSRADLALCAILAFYAGNDPVRIDKLFRRSKLYREKWERADYRDATILKGIELCNGTFCGGQGKPLADGRQRIQYLPQNLGDAARRAEAVLKAKPEVGLFERASCLCQVVAQRYITETMPDGSEQSRDLEPEDTVEPGVTIGYRYVIRPMKAAPFLCLLSDHMVFQRQSKKGDWGDTGIPKDLATALHQQESWSLPILGGVSELPILRDDGSVHSTPGYDPRTGYFLAGNTEFAIPDRPTMDDARQAANYLVDELLHDFPFVEACHLSAALALLLTLAARPCFRPEIRDENIPAFICTAPIRGSGKTLLFKAIHAGLFGQLPFISLVPSGKDEWSKTLLAQALEGAPVVLWDNVESGTAFGSPHLDAVLTSGSISGRILGISRTGRATLNAVHMISGNNLRVRGDLPRRVIPIRQDAKKARPELRAGFRHPDLVAWAIAHRHEIVVAAFTILRAHALAGFPKHGLKALGGFTKWDRVVRSPILWLGFADPCGGMQEIHDHDDDDTADRRELLEAFRGTFDDKWVDSRRVHAAAIAGKDQAPLGSPGPSPTLTPGCRLYNALLPEYGRRLTPGGVGKTLAAIVDAPAGGLVLRKEKNEGENKAKWRVEAWLEPAAGTSGASRSEETT